MIDSKPWFQSKTVWASIVAIVLSIGGSFGLHLPAGAQTIIADSLLSVSTGLAALFALYGRLVARSKID